jgi:hypothetical protein
MLTERPAEPTPHKPTAQSSEVKHPVKIDYAPPRPSVEPRGAVIRAIVHSVFWIVVILSAIFGVMVFAMRLKYGRLIK